MKRIKIGLAVMLILLGVKASAQGNLQFNQVVNFNLTGSTNGQTGTLTIQTINITVPDNKVWKIESATCRISSTVSPFVGSSTNNNVYILLDNNLIGLVNISSSLLTNQLLPIWIASGNHTIQLMASIIPTSQQQVYGLVSALEFNILP
jgi:hypothetical protein